MTDEIRINIDESITTISDCPLCKEGNYCPDKRKFITHGHCWYTSYYYTSGTTGSTGATISDILIRKILAPNKIKPQNKIRCIDRKMKWISLIQNLT